MLSKRFTPDEFVEARGRGRCGFDVAVFADMVAILSPYSDVDLDVDVDIARYVSSSVSGWTAFATRTEDIETPPP